MKAVQIKKYTKNLDVFINDIPIPNISNDEVLIKVKAAALNPLDILNINGSVKLIQNYKMPLTLGNECSGIIEKVGKNVKNFNKGDKVYTRLPIEKIGSFAEYVAVKEDAIALMPKGYDFNLAAAIPLTALTTYQIITEELKTNPNEKILITGGSGSLGQLFVPIAKHFGLNVIVTGNSRAKEYIMSLGADKYIDYTKESYQNVLNDIDYVVDTLGQKEFLNELKVLKKNGILLSLRNVPNKEFAVKNNFTFLKTFLFSIAEKKFDNIAKSQEKKYKFLFVRSNGNQLEKITKIIEKNNIKPKIHHQTFKLDEIKKALELLLKGKIDGKIIIEF